MIYDMPKQDDEGGIFRGEEEPEESCINAFWPRQKLLGSTLSKGRKWAKAQKAEKKSHGHTGI